MTSIIKMTPLSGVDDESPPCYLLQVDEFKFLLDCGWDETFNMDLIKNLKKHVQHLDAVFLSHPDPYHLGALPYLVGKMGLKCPIYATIPVFRMGQLFMYDVHQSRHNNEGFDLFSLDDIDTAFERIKQLTYNQSINVKGRIGTTLQITALPAGHMIGGTIWKIVKDDNEVIIYGVDYNHRKERHLDGCSFENIFRPHLFITDSYVTDYTQIKRVSKDEQLSNVVSKTLRGNGNVLIATDTAGRVLEIAYLLEQLWRNQDTGLMAYNLVMLNCVTYNVIEFAKALVEWMSEKVRKSMELQRVNHFQFKHLQICHTLAECNRVPEPKVVLASMPDMESGFSRDLFVQWCGNPNNSIIITSRTSPGTLARTLVDEPQLKKVTLKVTKKVRLEGFELEEYKRREMHQKIERVKVEESNNFDEDDLESSSDSDDNGWEDPCKTLRHGHDYAIKQVPKRKAASYPKLSKKACPMFPYKKKKLRQSDIGSDFDAKLFNKSSGTKYEQINSKQAPTSNTGSHPTEEREEPPSKYVTTTQNLDIKAGLVFIDFDGRADVEFLKNVVTQIKPLQMILVKGNKSSVDNISEYAKSQMPQNGRILIPRMNEALDSTMDSHVLQVKLSDALLSSFQLRKVKDYEVAWVDAMVTMDTTRGDRETALEEEEEEEDVIPTLDVLPAEKVRPHDHVFTNSLRLSEFKELLVRQGFKVEFCGGVLVINNKIKIKKNEDGCLIPEGVACRDFIPLMELIDKHFVTL